MYLQYEQIAETAEATTRLIQQNKSRMQLHAALVLALQVTCEALVEHQWIMASVQSTYRRRRRR
jgi:hypothetical protein